MAEKKPDKRDVGVGTSDIDLASFYSASSTSSFATAISTSIAALDSLQRTTTKSPTVAEESESPTTEKKPLLPSAITSLQAESEISTLTYESFNTLIGIEDAKKAKPPPLPSPSLSSSESRSSTSTMVEEEETYISTIKREPIIVHPVAADKSSTTTLVEKEPSDKATTKVPAEHKSEKAPKIHFQETIVENKIDDESSSTSEDKIKEMENASEKFAKEHAGTPALKSSKSRHVKKPPGGDLKVTKSQHVKKFAAEDVDFFEESSESTSEDSTNLEKGHVFVYMVLPPDGGYGWFITLMSFLCQVVVDGIMFSIGILLPHIAKEFNVPGSEVVFVASMQIGFYFLFGTVSSAFINKYGFRPVATTGALTAITVLSIATFSTNLPMLILFYSLLGGPCLSMIWVSSQLIIGYYFDKFRPIANGVSCSGAGAGIMIFGYMNSILVPKLGWRNVMRLHICFLILVLLMTLTFMEVAPIRIGRIAQHIKDEDTESETDSEGSVEFTRYSRFSLKDNEMEYPLDEYFEPKLEKPVETHKRTCPYCCKCCDELVAKMCPALNSWLEKRRERKAEEDSIKKYIIKQDLIEKQDLFYSGPKDRKKEEDYIDQILRKRTSQRSSSTISEDDIRRISLEQFENTARKKSIINTLSTMQMRRDGFSKGQKSYAQLKKTEKHPLLAFLSPQNLIHPKIIMAIKLLFDFRLIAIWEFRVLLLSAFLFPMGFNIPFVYSTVRSQIEPAYAKLITPFIGFSNFVFRIASGFIAFQFREYTTYICGGGIFFGGLAVFVSAFYGIDVVWFQFVYAVCYGIAPAFYSTLRAIIYVQTLGLDKLTNAFGLTALAMGMGVFIGTTAGGMLNELTGGYSASFFFAGTCICTSGGLKLILPFLIKRAKAKETKRQRTAGLR